jgi:phage FluMu gp28-like protein
MKVNRIYADETGLGRGIVPLLRRDLTSVNIEGVNFNPSSKEDMVMGLKTLMEQGNLLLPQRDIQLQGQIRNIKREISPAGTTRYSGKPHDDMFWALALAARGGRHTKFAIYQLGSRSPFGR